MKTKSPAIKTKIHATSENVKHSVDKAEHAAVNVVERAEGAMDSVKSGFATAKVMGAEMMTVVDNAGRTTIGGIVTMNSSLVNYGKEVMNDSMEVGRKTLESKSIQDVVALQTAFAERRINSAFHTMAAMNTLAQTNVMAMWTPFASFARQTGEAASQNGKKASF
jgi:hypothetical protein